MLNKVVLVTTASRGVFVGTLESQDGDKAMLTDARCAIYWGTTGGVLQLAATGPTAKSRIGAKASRLALSGVTMVAECSEAAVSSWAAL